MHELMPWLALILQRRARLLVGALLLALTLFSAIGLLALSGWFITATGVTALLWAAGQKVMFDVYMPGGGIRFFALTRTVARYAERTGRDVSNIDYYVAISHWRLAVISEGVYARYLKGVMGAEVDRATLDQLAVGTNDLATRARDALDRLGAT